MKDSFDFQGVFAKDLPAPAGRWGGFAKYNFIGGHNDPDGIPIDGLIESAERVLRRRGHTLATYNLDGGPLGDPELRKFLAEKLKKYRGFQPSEDEILITSGSNHALTLLYNTLLDPGDTVIAEEHSYAGALGRMANCGAKILPCALDGDGLRADALAEILELLRKDGVTPKFVYAIPTIQNPTSTVMPVERRREILSVTREYGVPVIEDECYADLLWDEAWPNSMCAMEGSDHVIHVGSFSKYLSPALRLGYVAAPWSVLSQMLALKNDGGTSALAQMVVADFMRDHYDDHVAALNERLKRKRDVLIEALQEQFGASAEFDVPPGGIYLWIKLPDEVDTLALSDAALAEGIAFNPGPQWSANPEAATHHLRICFAYPSEETIREGVAKLADVCHREYGVPVRSANVSR
ncbi:MAG: PLP-dependent aminotransferase family protein [Pseudomonadota bacterium]